MAESTEKRSYKQTLNLPKTGFGMKANLVQNEPASLKRWQQAGLYQRIRELRKGSPRWVFHDGPPYANGSIHLGHLLNKVLKDLVVRSRTMMGFDVPYTPGWDCHGLPIEHKVMQESAAQAGDPDVMKVRYKCKAYAEKYVKLQSQQMQRLLTLADYDEPYLTMAPGYEAAVLDVFGQMVKHGLVYRALKPVHWSIENRTALAEAELEYYDRQDTSVYVLFDLDSAPASAKLPGIECASLLIWTTTPWTLPANMAVAVAPRAEYGVYPIDDSGRVAIIATELAPRVLAAAGRPVAPPFGVMRGSDLVGATYRHPFINRTSPVVAADYVTLEDGTGLVHTAPGHGVEDYQTGKRVGLEIYCPVQADGTFDNTAPQWLRGVDVWKANGLVVEKLRESGHLFHDHKFTHSYPHDWRGKTPTIFRATEQWFIAVDRNFSPPGTDKAQTLRDMALAATEKQVAFVPDWGRNRMRGMLESRPDWCISRQRAWGLPIPAFFPPPGVEGEPLLTPASITAVAEVFRQHGSDSWFKLDAAALLANYDAANDPDAPQWAKASDHRPLLRLSGDIFDVWFESGCSWNAALKRMQGDYPADLYLEGSDQHRGWFQVSLLPSLAVTGKPAFAALLTHGFMVDKDGRKMSKSLGNTVEVDALLKELGADVCRWWVCSLNTDNDIKVDMSFFRLAGEEYRKVRNTIRFLLSNLSDFDASVAQPAPEPTSLDAWALGELDRLVRGARECYEQFDFRALHEMIFNFCNDTLSAVYLAAVKDRLYCDAANGPRRRQTQAVIHAVSDALIRLIAPVLPHTADEAWTALHGETTAEKSVHLELLPKATQPAVDDDWAKVMTDREGWLKALEEARAGRGIDNPLDLGLKICACPAASHVQKFDPVDLADLCGISRVELVAQAGDCPQAKVLEVVDLRQEPRCERSWKRDGSVTERSDGGMLSQRDALALGLA